jgi:hypothetical protein
MIEDVTVWCASKLMRYNATGDSAAALQEYFTKARSAFLNRRKHFTGMHWQVTQRGVSEQEIPLDV